MCFFVYLPTLSKMPKNSKNNDDGQFDALRPMIEQIIKQKITPIHLTVSELKSKTERFKKRKG